MDNEEGSQNFWKEIAQEAWDAEESEEDLETRKENVVRSLEDRLKEHHEEALPELEGFAADLLGAAMSEVNWREIAIHMVDDLISELEAE